MKHLRYLLFIVLAAALLPCVAQKRDINLTLHVTAPGGVSASDAHVVLRHVGYSLSYGRITLDSEGTTVVRVYAGEHSLEVSKSGIGRLSRTVCRITDKGRKALHAYEDGLRKLFEQRIPEKSVGTKKAI